MFTYSHRSVNWGKEDYLTLANCLNKSMLELGKSELYSYWGTREMRCRYLSPFDGMLVEEICKFGSDNSIVQQFADSECKLVSWCLTDT